MSSYLVAARCSYSVFPQVDGLKLTQLDTFIPDLRVGKVQGGRGEGGREGGRGGRREGGRGGR